VIRWVERKKERKKETKETGRKKVDAKRPSRPAPACQGRPAGIMWRSSRNTYRTRDHGGWYILLYLPFTHHPLPAQKAHFTPNEWQERGTSAGDWRWRVYTNNVAATTTNGADPSGKLIVRTYIRYLLPQLLWCMPLHVMFSLPTTSLHLVRPSPCCMCWLRTICTSILAKYMYACAYPT
jgi:hypothetical protein